MSKLLRAILGGGTGLGKRIEEPIDIELNGFFDEGYDRREELYLRPMTETTQWIDTIAQFAPIRYSSECSS